MLPLMRYAFPHYLILFQISIKYLPLFLKENKISIVFGMPVQAVFAAICCLPVLEDLKSQVRPPGGEDRSSVFLGIFDIVTLRVTCRLLFLVMCDQISD